MKRILSIFALIVLMFSILAGCAERKKYYAGEKVSPEDIVRYSEEIFESESIPKTNLQDKETDKTDPVFSDTDKPFSDQQTEKTAEPSSEQQTGKTIEPSIEETTNTTEFVSEKTPDITSEDIAFSETETNNPELDNALEIDIKKTEDESDKIVNTQIYYWTPSGEKYHLYRDCSTLSRSKTIVSGTLEEGKAAGKSGLCKTCEKKLNNN